MAQAQWYGSTHHRFFLTCSVLHTANSAVATSGTLGPGPGLCQEVIPEYCPRQFSGLSVMTERYRNRVDAQAQPAHVGRQCRTHQRGGGEHSLPRELLRQPMVAGCVLSQAATNCKVLRRVSNNVISTSRICHYWSISLRTYVRNNQYALLSSERVHVGVSPT